MWLSLFNRVYTVWTPGRGMWSRPLGEILHGTEVGEVLYFDYLKLGDSDDGYAYVLVRVDDVSSFVSLQPAASCTSEVASKSILEWVSVLGTPEEFVSNGSPYIKNGMLKLVAAKVGASHRFSVAYSSWSNGTVERINLEVVRTFQEVMSERGRPLSEWPDTNYLRGAVCAKLGLMDGA